MSDTDARNVELLQGTLDLIILRILSTMGPQHAYALAARIEQIADHALTLNQGTLYPALVRLEQKSWTKGRWARTDNNREARFYAITEVGPSCAGSTDGAVAPVGKPGEPASL
jgi:PadR family transcriptional regulator